MATARFLLEVGVDGFAVNKLSRSPLSMAIESLPELALELLNTKSRFEYRWWGNDLYWFSFTGIVLPLSSRDHDASSNVLGGGVGVSSGGAQEQEQEQPQAGRGGGGGGDGQHARPARPSRPGVGERKEVFPLTFRDKGGNPATLEDLIVRHERKELLETPVMLDLIERKWMLFAAEGYRTRIGIFAAMCVSVFVVAVENEGTPIFFAGAASALPRGPSSCVCRPAGCCSSDRRLRGPRRRSRSTT